MQFDTNLLADYRRTTFLKGSRRQVLERKKEHPSDGGMDPTERRVRKELIITSLIKGRDCL